MSRGGIGGALLILLLATSAVGYTLLDLGMGSQVFQGSAQCGGMGEVSQLTESTPLSLIRALRPDVLAKGGDWALGEIVGREEVERWGGRVVRLRQVPGVRTTSLLARIDAIDAPGSP